MVKLVIWDTIAPNMTSLQCYRHSGDGVSERRVSWKFGISWFRTSILNIRCQICFTIAGILIVCTILMSALSLIANVVIVNLHSKTPKRRMPKRLHIFVFKILSRIICHGTTRPLREIGMGKSRSNKPTHHTTNNPTQNLELKSSKGHDCQIPELAGDDMPKDPNSVKYEIPPYHNEQLINDEWNAAADVLDRSFLCLFISICFNFGIYELFQWFK